MKTNLVDVIEIAENNKDFILLEVIGDRKSCILTGVLDGDEDLIRVTKGENHDVTIYKKDGTHFSYYFGNSGHTCISHGEELRRDAIKEVIENDLETSLENVSGFNLVKKKADAKGRCVTFKIYNDKCVHKNGRFYKHSNNPMEEINKNYKDIKELENYVSDNGCKVQVLSGTRK